MPGAAEGTSSSGAGPDACGSAHPGTIAVRLLSLSGAPVQLEALSLDATVRDLALQVRARLEMPISVQHLILGTSTLADPSASLRDVFGQAPSAEVTVVRRPFTPEERAKLHTQLVRAVAAGQAQQFRELLLEGAQVNFRAEGHGADTSVSLAHWGPPAEEAAPPAAPASAESPAGGADGAGGGGAEVSNSDADSEQMSTDSEADAAPAVEAPCGGLTPLLVAIAVGDQELARDLRQLGALEPDMATKYADLPTAFGHMDFVDIVKHLAAGADVNARLSRRQGIVDTSEGAPLHACAAQFRRPGAFEVAQILVRKGADMSSADSEGDNPVAHARYFGATEMSRLFKGHGAKIEGPFFERFGGF